MSNTSAAGKKTMPKGQKLRKKVRFYKEIWDHKFLYILALPAILYTFYIWLFDIAIHNNCLSELQLQKRSAQ